MWSGNDFKCAIKNINSAIDCITSPELLRETSLSVGDLTWTNMLLGESIDTWRLSPVTAAEALKSESEYLPLSARVVMALIQSVPEDSSFAEFSSSHLHYNWHESNKENAKYFHSLLEDLLDSWKKIIFSKQVATLALSNHLEGCTGATFTERGKPWDRNSVDLAELDSFMKNFSRRISAIVLSTSMDTIAEKV